jgi:tetratricopeptide (TPR) repeat protein
MKRPWSACLSVAVALLTFAPTSIALAQSSAASQKLFTDAFASQNKGNYSKALQLWNQLIQEDPSEPAAYVNRGITRYYLKDLRGAVDDLSAAIERKSDYTDAYYNRAAILSAMKDYQGALADYEKYLELAPPDVDRKQVQALIDNLRKRVGTTTAANPGTARTGMTTAANTTSTTSPSGTTGSTGTTGSEPAATMGGAATGASTNAGTNGASTAAMASTGNASASESNESTVASTSFLPSAQTVQLPPGVYSLGKISGYDATTEDLLLGLKLTTSRKLLSPSDPIYKKAQNFVVLMKRGKTIDQALQGSGLDRQSLIRLTWRGAAWRTYKVYIR